jgi:uncharacterized protein (DUF1800 family)
MPLSRRHFLHLAGLVAASAAAAACAPLYDRLAGEPRTLSSWLQKDAALFGALNRLTFGPRVEERRRAAEIGLQAWVEEQLAPETIGDEATDWKLHRFDTLTLRAHELYDRGEKLFDDLDKAGVPDELRQATLVRQVYSRRQLYEAMVEFWTDHFNISVEKGDCWYLKTVDDRDVIRRHALGNFRDLLWASAHSPAMLIYLDQQVSDKTHPNENYAREVMELHTLGVDGGYSQQDVMELARCLTGWTVKEHWWRGDFAFDSDKHDDDVKTVLGTRIEPDGQAEAERVLDLLAAHPATARFIARKLAQRFIGPEPPAELIVRTARTFTQTGGDLRAVLRTLLLDGLPQIQPKYKRPLHVIASSLRQLNAHTDGGPALHTYLARLGQKLFAWPTPDGFPDRAEAWQGNLQPRWQFALALAQNNITGTQLDLNNLLEASDARTSEQIADQFALLLLGASMPVSARDDLLTSLHRAGADDETLPAALVAGLVASPAFQWR